MQKLFSKPSFVYALFGISLLLYGLSNWTTNPRQDDDCLGEGVYWLAKNGRVQSNLMSEWRGIGLENYQSVFHKLLVYNGFIAVKLLGWSAVSLHLVSLFYYAVFFGIVFLYYRRQPDASPLSFWVYAMLALIYAPLAYYSFDFRPEVMLMTIGFLSFICVERHIQTKGNRYLVLAGLLAGLAFMTHLNGMIYCIAGFVVLALHRRYWACVGFAACAMLAFSLYFVDILYYADLPYFWHQFRNDPSLRHEDFSWVEPFRRLSREHMRLFFSQREGSLMLLLILAWIPYYKRFWTEKRVLSQYLLTQILALSLLTYSTTATYMLLHIPFILLFVESAIRYTQEKRVQWYSALVLVYMGIQTYTLAEHIRDNFTAPDDVAQYALAGQFLPKENARIVATGYFIFNEIEKPNTLITLLRFAWHHSQHHHGEKLDFNGLLAQVREMKADYLVLDRNYEKFFNVTDETYRRADIQLVENPSHLKIIKLQ